MFGPLAYEPSVQSIISALLPSASVIAGSEGLRRRVSWSVVARATGLGEIEGGELILVPEGRARPILASLRDLEVAGVTGVVLSRSDLTEVPEMATCSVPLVVVAPGTDVRVLHEDIERFIARRRRELFALEQRLHRALTEAAIGGADIDDLLSAACALAGKTAVLDRDGEVQYQPTESLAPPEDLLLRVRIAAHATPSESVLIDGPPLVVAAPVVAGNERRGIVMLLGAGMPSLDDEEAILRSLASACAIVLARVPAEPTRTLAETLRAIQVLPRPRWEQISVLALTDASGSTQQVARGMAAELSARDIEHEIAVEGDAVIAITAGSADLPWSAIARAIGLRLGTRELRAGLGRQYGNLAEASRSAWEAKEAMDHSEGGSLTRFPEIELVTLLRTDPAWLEFARVRLGPLLDESSGPELLRTLRAYLSAGLNAKEAAGALHVHRNTLLYRLRRMRDVLGVDLEDADAVFELDLAMRVLEAVRDVPMTAADEA